MARKPKIAAEDVQKAVAAMEEAAKKLGIEKGALFHTASNSDPGGWAGSKHEPVNEADDGIDESGMDYGAVKKALVRKAASKPLSLAEAAILAGENPLPAIFDKAKAGENLTQAETWALNGGLVKMAKMKHDYEDEDEEEKEEKKAKKAARSSSDDLSKTFDARLQVLVKAQEERDQRNAEFQEQIAKAVSLIGAQIAADAEVNAAVAQGPARGPLSQLAPEPGKRGELPAPTPGSGFGAFSEFEVSKAQTGAMLAEMIQKGEPGVKEIDVYNWDCFGVMSDGLRQRVLARLAGN